MLKKIKLLVLLLSICILSFNAKASPRDLITGTFSEGLAEVWQNDKMGYIDKSGKIVIPIMFESGGAFSEGLAPVEVNGKWGYIDETGKIVIRPKFDEAEPFKNGFARIQNEHEKYGFIDKTGKIVIKPQFVDVENFIDGLARVEDGYEFTFLVGYINMKGNFVWKKKSSN